MFITRQTYVIQNVNGVIYRLCEFECDSVSDLPSQAQTGWNVMTGSKAHVIDTNSWYAIKSTGAWVLQNSDGTAGYTKEEIDALIQNTKDYADGEILGAINDLDVPAVGGTTRYIYQISETNGKISASAYTSDATPTTGSTKLVQSGGVKTYVDDAKTAANSYTDTAVANKITMLNILGAGQRITATEEEPLNFNDAPFTSVGRFNWLSTSTPNITNCPTYIGGVAKGGLLETSYIQGGTTILQTAYPSAGADSANIFWRRFRYGSPGTWTPWYAFTGTLVQPQSLQSISPQVMSVNLVNPINEVDEVTDDEIEEEER